TDLSAERTPAEAQARVPCAHGDACRPRDPEAPPGEGPQAALRLEGHERHALLARDYPAAYAPPLPADALARLRRRLPARPLGLDALPRPLLVSPRGPGRRAAPRAGRTEAGRQCGGAEPREAAAPRPVALAARVDPGRPRLRARRSRGLRRGGGEPRRRLARRAAGRGTGQGGRVRYV